MSSLQEMIREGRAIEALQAHLDALCAADRRAEVLGLAAADLEPLYERARGCHLELDFLVPADIPPGREVVHHGRNSLPLVGGIFRKHFTRMPGDGDRLAGFNDSDGIVGRIGWLTGPGYFVVRPRGCAHPDGRTDSEQLFIDYYETPRGAPPVPGWPPPLPNDGPTRGLIFGRMCDYMWRVSTHVSIGAAYKKGRPVGQYFALVREDRA